MEIIESDTLDDRGRMLLLYGETGVGKTQSILQTIPKPCLWIPLERKDAKKNYSMAVEIAGLKKSDIMIAKYEDWQDTMDFLYNPENTQKFASIFVDGLTHLMFIDMMQEIENQSLEGMKKNRDLMDKIKDKPLAYIVKGGQENYGTLNTVTIRMLEALTELSLGGKCIVFSALLDENPKWNRELSASPLIAGKAFAKSIPVFFGTIGLVVPITKDGKVTYPPGVKLRSDDDSFMARYTGHPDSKTNVRLDINAILAL